MHSCSYCGKTGKVVKGLCLPCYYRQKKTGSLEYQRKGKTTPCTVEECDGRAVSGGLCAKHYGRMRRHGHLGQTRPDDWGVRNDHPLTTQWNYLHSRKGVEMCAPEWRTDFARFVADVGAQPSPKHKLRRRDRNMLIGPNNFIWADPEVERQAGETAQEASNRAERIKRAEHPELFRDRHLRKKYAGLSLADVEAMKIKQEGLCAICEEALDLVVDHDHNDPKEAVRGLLCNPCNRGLGFFRDSPARLQAAIAYLASPPGEAAPRTPIRRRKPRANNELDADPE